MPLVRVEMIKGKDREYKKTLLDCIHEGLAEAFGIDDEDRFQRIYELDGEDFERASDKTDDFMIIELTIFPGRSTAQKGNAIRYITSKISERLQVSPRDIFIVINEPPMENWGFAGQQR
ncbi:MAG: tautomerase family protein [Oscillospiraceae bacterium]|nr:tautomerase family protein [Oscillospiraceae bacterium]